jgi:Icc-related predicted phosphoesterase
MARIRVAMLSDTHGHHEDVRILGPCDLLIFAGDMCQNGAHVAEINSFARWLATRGVENVVFVAGNHDFTKTKSASRTKSKTDASATGAHTRAMRAGMAEMAGWQPRVKIHTLSPTGVVGIQVAPDAPPLVIAGAAPCQMPEGPWVYNWKATAISKAVDELPRCDIFVSHAPPRNIMDKLPVGWPIGEEAYLDYVRRVNPALHVFGHVHAQRGVVGDAVEGLRTVFANVSMCDDAYDLVSRRASVATLEFVGSDWEVVDVEL